MSRKNKTLRAFLHQTRNPAIKQAWDAAWKHAQKTFHARSMQDMEEQLAAAQAENEQLRRDVSALVGALTELCDEIDKHDIHAAISKTSISWFKRKARKALAAYRKGR